VQLLERRLDSVVFRAGFARTIPAARQLVTHGHVLVNGKRLSYPSARIRVGDVITVGAGKGENAVRKQQELGAVLTPPTWLEVETSALSAKVAGLPDIDSVPFPVELPLVVE